MSDGIIGVPIEHTIPAGALRREPVKLDVRAYLVPHATGLLLVDTGIDPGAEAIDTALDRLGATWSDVSYVVISHIHRDHVAGLDRVRAAAPGARLFASPLDGLPAAEAAADGDTVGSLRVIATPGHTRGHLSFIDEDRGVLLVGDGIGVVAGELVRAPERFTADLAVAEMSIRRLLDFRGARMLFAHGPEIADPWTALDSLLES